MAYTLIKTNNALQNMQWDFKEKNIFALNRFSNKFKNDKFFGTINDKFYCIDGVILNLGELYKEYACNKYEQLLEKMFLSYGINFIKYIKGNFSGVIYDIKEDKIYAFTNHTGNKFVYYFFDDKNNDFVISTDLYDLLKYKKILGHENKLSEEGAYYMLTFGYMLLDHTLVEDVKRINYGSYLKVKDNNIKQKKYFIYDNENILDIPIERAVSEQYELLRNSIKLSFEKDKEYNLNHFTFLSGGLDSRMILFIANSLGFKDITAATFSKKYSYDEKIAREIVNDLGVDYIFNGLNDGEYIKHISKYVDRNFGQIIYVGAAHLVSFLDKLNLEKFGLIHNGNLADIMHGDYIDKPYHTKPIIEKWAYSKKLLNKLDGLQDAMNDIYPNEEIFAIHNRGMNAIYNGSISLHPITETIEDFTYPDLVQFSMKLDPKYKYSEMLFIEMIERYHPEATKYGWQRWCCKPTINNYKIMTSKIGKVYSKVISTYNKARYGENSYLSMNPYNYWYNKNHSLKIFFSQYFNENIDLIKENHTLKKDCLLLFNEGSVLEKCQVITLLSFVKKMYNI